MKVEISIYMYYIKGEMKNDVKDGSGIYYYASGEQYDGFFSDDVINGYGCYYFLGGHKYEGIVFIMILKVIGMMERSGEWESFR